MPYDKPNPDSPFENQEFSSLFNELYEPLCRNAMRMVRNRACAEDIVQEQFIYFWENRKRIVAGKSISTYMHIGVRNRAISHLKKTFRNVLEPFPDQLPDTNSSLKLQDPLSLLETKELNTIIEKAIGTLPDRCRTIYLLKKFSGMSNKEVAEELNISVKTVEAQMTIAFKRLIAYITHHWGVIVLLLMHYFSYVHFF